jgi:glycosyltransferase involved in cell wall biosynthesis
MHITDLPVENPWFNAIAEHYDRGRFHQSLVSLGPRCDLHAALESRDMPAYALGAIGKKDYPRAVVDLRSLLRRERVDLVQTHMFYPSLLGLVAASLAGSRIKVVTRHHSDFTTLYHRPIHRQLDRLQAHWADRVLAASAAVERAMVRYEHVPPRKITVARYGYDFDRLAPRLTPAERRQLRDDLGGDDRVLVATIARLSPAKGHEDLFNAFAGLVAEYDVVLLLAGRGPLRQELEERARALGLAGQIRFLGWRPDVWKIIEASNLVVHPSYTEAFCSVIIEAQALERPLVATNVSAAPEQVDDGETGLLVPPHNPAALRAAVQRLLADPAAAAAMGREARRRVVDRFGISRAVARYESIYDELLDGVAA